MWLDKCVQNDFRIRFKWILKKNMDILHGIQSNTNGIFNTHNNSYT